MTVLGPETQAALKEHRAFKAEDKNLIEENFEAASALTAAVSDQNERVPLAKPNESFLSFTARTLNELRFVKFALASFVINGLRRRYQRSFLGFAWSLLNPLLMMIVLTTVFSLLFDRDPRTFSIYLFTGLLPWTFISESITAGSQSITHAEGFMKKVYIPKLFFPLVAVTTELINSVLSLVSMMFLALFVGMQLHSTLWLLPVALLVTYLYTLGLVLALAVATVYFRDLTHLLRVILASFFYLIPIVYPLSAVPPKYMAFFVSNPFSYFINLYRQIIFYGCFPTWKEWAIPIVLTVAALILGLYVLMKREKDIIFRL